MLDAKGRYPNVYGQDDAWRLRVRVWLVRHPGGLVLFDTGVGPESSPAMDWCPEPGVAAASLAEVGAAPEMIDVVALSHAHDDHIGGILSGEGAPAFPRARYLLQRADDSWRRGMDQDDRSSFERLVAPLEGTGALELLDGVPSDQRADRAAPRARSYARAPGPPSGERRGTRLVVGGHVEPSDAARAPGLVGGIG